MFSAGQWYFISHSSFLPVFLYGGEEEEVLGNALFTNKGRPLSFLWCFSISEMMAIENPSSGWNVEIMQPGPWIVRPPRFPVSFKPLLLASLRLCWWWFNSSRAMVGWWRPKCWVGPKVCSISTLFSKGLGENEKCVFYLYLKPNQLSGQCNM